MQDENMNANTEEVVQPSESDGVVSQTENTDTQSTQQTDSVDKIQQSLPGDEDYIPQTCKKPFKQFNNKEEWQAEIDRIMGKRLANMRHLKQTADSYANIVATLKTHFGDDDEKGLIKKLENHLADNTYTNAKNEYDENKVTTRIAQIDSQIKALSAKQKDFDMSEEIKNADFCKYVWEMGLDVEQAYFLVHRDSIIKQKIDDAKRAIASSIASKAARIAENGTVKSVGTNIKIDTSRLKDSEIDDIISRAKQGEKIVF